MKISNFWLRLVAVTLLIIGYLASIPFSLRAQRHLVRNTPAPETAPVDVPVAGNDDDRRDAHG